MSEENKEPQSVGEIKIQMGDQAIVFTPLEDITAYEVSKLMVMLINGLMAKTTVDFGSYINQNNLGKHFSAVKVES